MTNREYDEVHFLAQELNIDLTRCPTCKQRRTEVAPGVWIWGPSEYRMGDTIFPCDCEAQENLQRHYLLARIPRNYWTLGPDQWVGDPDALDAINDYLTDWDKWRGHGIGLELYSPTLGTGKTMLACMVAKYAVREGERVHFVAFRDILDVHQAPYEERKHLETRLRNTPVLVLDEVGSGWTQAQRDYFAEALEGLIRHRTNGNGVTIVTTNLTPAKLDETYPRTFSLLAPKQHRIYVKGDDARRGGELDLREMTLAINGHARPIY